MVYPLTKERKEEGEKTTLPQIRLSLKRAKEQKKLQIKGTSPGPKTIQRLIRRTKRTLLKELRPSL